MPVVMALAGRNVALLEARLWPGGAANDVGVLIAAIISGLQPRRRVIIHGAQTMRSTISAGNRRSSSDHQLRQRFLSSWSLEAR
jgi:hypothetical protein